jgi:signal transduction histidine kinase
MGCITVRTRRDSDHARIEIADTGTGISPEIRDRIFEPFFTTKGVGRGTGQGLALTYDIVVNKHGGRVDFVSQPGQGTTFIITLPINKSAAKAA